MYFRRCLTSGEKQHADIDARIRNRAHHTPPSIHIIHKSELGDSRAQSRMPAAFTRLAILAMVLLYR
jgi:hypothetical protein